MYGFPGCCNDFPSYVIVLEYEAYNGFLLGALRRECFLASPSLWKFSDTLNHSSTSQLLLPSFLVLLWLGHSRLCLISTLEITFRPIQITQDLKILN